MTTRLHFNGIQAKSCPVGGTWKVILSWEDSKKNKVNFFEYPAIKMQVRKNFNNELIQDLSLDNGKISVDSNADMVLYLSDEDTYLMEPGKYVYDLYIENTDGEVFRFLEGEFLVTPTVTL